MSDDRTPITGPIPVTVRVTPTAVVLNMEALRDLVVADVINELLHADDTTAWDLLHQAADPDTAGEFDGELLAQHLAERCSSRVPLTVPRARDLASTLRMLADRLSVPRQQNRRHAA